MKKTTTTIRISKTGYAGGWGSDPWKYSAGFTPDERAAIRRGELVAFESARQSGGNHGTYWRIAIVKKRSIYDRGYYTRRVPTADELRLIEEK